MSTNYIVRFSNLTISVEEKVIINNLHVDFTRNTCTVLTGPGGSGKTTLFGIIMKDDLESLNISGSVDVNASKIRFMKQGNHFDSMDTPSELFASHGLLYFEEISKCWAKTPHLIKELRKLAFTSFNNIDKKYHKLLHLTAVIANDDFDLLLLDEPEVYADENLTYLTDKILELKQRKSILVITHHVAFAEQIGDYFLLLIHGRPVEYCNKMSFFSSSIPEVQYLTKMGC